MRSKSLRRSAASLGVALCLSLLHVPAAAAKPLHSAPARSRQAAARPASPGFLSTLWSHIITVITGSPTSPATIDPNAHPLSDLGGAADPNGAL